MSQLNRRVLGALALALAAWAVPGMAQACTTSTTNIDLGDHSSYAVAAASQSGSGSAGLQCDILLAALTAHYIGLQVDASTLRLTGPAGGQIAYAASLTPNGTPLTVGNFRISHR